ncbi:MAG TPA: type II secretion system protein [Gammaproteobacteria bacterium]|nr:type II secretion system protein [Gammaproteobacteria bacterium]
MRITKWRSFSLIELLVVISIAAVLSAIAIAQYQTYSSRVKLEQAMIVFNSLGDKAKTYYDSHGSFPNLQQINMAFDPMNPNQTVMANTLNDYIANYVAFMFLQDQGTTYTCPAVGFGGYISNLSGNDFITQGQNGTVVAVNQLLVNVRNTYKYYCQYYYMQYDPVTTNTTVLSGNFIPSCTNGADDPNAANYFPDAGNQC